MESTHTPLTLVFLNEQTLNVYAYTENKQITSQLLFLTSHKSMLFHKINSQCNMIILPKINHNK